MHTNCSEITKEEANFTRYTVAVEPKVSQLANCNYTETKEKRIPGTASSLSPAKETVN